MVSLFLPVFAFAQTSSSSITTLLEQIKALQAQMVALQQQQKTLVQQQQTNVISLIKTLKEGSSGDDVKALQALLAADSSIYPEGIVSGVFGRLTGEAVKRFQKKHGLDPVGNVGPRTMKLLNELFGKHGMKWELGTSTATSTRPHFEDRKEVRDRMPCFVNPAGNAVPLGWFRKGDDDNRGRGSNGERGERNDRWVVRPCPGGATSTPPVSPPADTTGPIISGAAVSGVATTSSTVSWTTNEAATSKVYYSTTSPVNLGTALTMSNGSLTTGHSFGLTSLSASTTYFYVLESKDAANNTATTSSSSFTTTN
jgi:peptidoglycan hydrolase-like protein with peptidoglycan-binding domain